MDSKQVNKQGVIARFAEFLRGDAVGGAFLVIPAVIAVILANSPARDVYFAIRDTQIGFEMLGLNLTIGQWAADALLSVFFFMVGLELKHEFTAGALVDPKKAALPIVAAMGGVATPAFIYFLFNFTHPESIHGWAIPAATDIAFAVAVLALIGKHLPPVLRIFLLTLAVMDDLLAISIIAIFYSSGIDIQFLILAFLPMIAFWFVANKLKNFFLQNPYASLFILLPIGILAWIFVFHSGIHATIAGVLLGLTVPSTKSEYPSTENSLVLRLNHTFDPISSGFAVPIFAFFSAGVFVGGMDGLLSIATSEAALGVIAGLVIGKPLGITLTVFLMHKFTNTSIDPSITWIDVIGMGCVAGIGFTVSLLISELSFPGHAELMNATKAAILMASFLSAIIGSIILIPRDRHYKKLAEKIAPKKA